MDSLTVGQKADRVLKLLIGLRIDRVARALRAQGFTENDREMGYQLLSDLTLGQLEATPKSLPSDEQSGTPVDPGNCETTMWNWYVQWRTIVRSEINDPWLLKELGLSPTEPRFQAQWRQNSTDDDGVEAPWA